MKNKEIKIQINEDDIFKTKFFVDNQEYVIPDIEKIFILERFIGVNSWTQISKENKIYGKEVHLIAIPTHSFIKFKHDEQIINKYEISLADYSLSDLGFIFNKN